MSGDPALDERRARSARQDALLLLRPAVRHSAQGERQRGHRLRAVGGVSVQPRHALPEGRETLSAGLASGSLAHGTRRDPSRASGFSPARLRRGDQPGRGRNPIASRQAHGARRHGAAERRQPDHREDLPDGQVRPRVPASTPYIDYNGRLCMVSAGAANKKAFGIDRAANPWSDMLGTDVIWIAGPTSPSARRSPRTTCGRPASRARRSSSTIRASRRSPVPAICSCR